MPYDDLNNLAKYEQMMQNASAREGMLDIRRSFEAAYQEGAISYEAYTTLYNIWTAQYGLPEDQWPRKNINLETATDPRTAYQARLGIGGKQFYNPAESYQADLFDPYKSQYDIQERVNRPGGIYQDPARQQGSFSEFLNARGGGGLPGLISGAQGQLKNIFGGTTAQKTSFYQPDPSKTGFSLGLGYEPGIDATAGASTMDEGRIEELQNLLRYGLRGQVGSLGAAYSARALPRAQQAYYEQKAAGTAGAESFLDWLKQNWGLQF